MNINFKSIAILGCPRYSSSFLTHVILYNWLLKRGYQVFIERSIVKYLSIKNVHIATHQQIGERCDLAIVIGGDGNMLYISRILSYYSIKIIGINRGNLGFLTDLNHDNMLLILSDILSGKFYIENRFLLELRILNNQINQNSLALNEVVVHPVYSSNTVEFSVYINKRFALYQRSDGLIISTPTGSTGYSLSAGGPILSSDVDGMMILSMFPHTLSSRPIIVNSNSLIMLKVFNIGKTNVSCDGNIIFSIDNKTKIFIYKSKYYIRFIHHIKYSYLNVLHSKLHWAKNLF
ncbi:NAD kinase [Buchnera aphidicola (Pterocallis alni)]|uniref:NAD(+)/NADH kinase n=1 Tax=Buchnera aphidicola TaxID=9 RepID=UPI003464A836